LVDMSVEEILAYTQGYDDNERDGNHKELWIFPWILRARNGLYKWQYSVGWTGWPSGPTVVISLKLMCSTGLSV
jgi:hypothetical protein